MAELVKLICHDYMSKRWCIVQEAKRVQVDLLRFFYMVELKMHESMKSEPD